MLWLVAQMWTLIGLAALFGLLFGWGFRGLRLKASARRAIVERDIALTELDQTRAELDGLYAAQRRGIGAASTAGDEALRQELVARESKVASLNAALAESREEMRRLKEKREVTPPATAPAAAAGPAAAGTPPRLDAAVNPAGAELEWRNRYLESRVRSLEADISRLADHARADPARPENADAAQPEAPGLPAEPPEAPGAETEKMRWQNAYLRTRLAYFEAYPLQPRDAPATAPAERKEASAALPAAADGPNEIEQELARLRWRNRYLEGRLAYVDGDTVRGEGPASGPAAPRDRADHAGPAGVSPVEAFLATVDAGGEIAKPDMLAEPADGGDDLTLIRGVGPGAKDTLNGLGIWRFSQIAAWSPANRAWIRRNLPSIGDADHSDWCRQAEALARGGGTA